MAQSKVNGSIASSGDVGIQETLVSTSVIHNGLC